MSLSPNPLVLEMRPDVFVAEAVRALDWLPKPLVTSIIASALNSHGYEANSVEIGAAVRAARRGS